MRHFLRCASLLVTVTLFGCGGGGSEEAPGGSASFSTSGVAAGTKPMSNAAITAYGTDGRSCASGTSDAQGEFSISGSCKVPVLVVADTPEKTGFETYALVTKSGDRANLTPLSAAVAQLVLGAPPSAGIALNANLITATRLAAAQARVAETVNTIATKMGIGDLDFAAGSLQGNTAFASFLEAATITSELIPSASKQLIRIHLASEHRPVVIARDTRQGIETAAVDSGLGVAIELVSQERLRSLTAVLQELRSSFEGVAAAGMHSLVDGCFLHNGTAGYLGALFDVPLPFGIAAETRLTNLRLHRFNTYTDLTNETEERLNAGPASLAFVSFDFVDGRGMTQRAYTWLIKGAQSVNGCDSSGAGWRVLGNQRPVYVRSSTYALHRIMYNAAFAGRTDTFGTGGEFFVESGPEFAYALVSGPGLPANGGILYHHDGAYLRYNGTVTAIRTAAVTNNLKPVYDAIEDTRSFVMTDVQVREVTDGYYAPQNRYVVRLFRQPQDLHPALTIVDVLPKRPYLASEVKAGIFPSVAVNMDSLVTALQTSEPVTVNWSLPNDVRGKPLVARAVAFMRKNCLDEKRWPGCATRSTQYNEYSLGQRWIFDLQQASTTLVSPRQPPAGGKTFESHVRVHVLDSLARPLEVTIGMTYQR